MPQKVCFFGGAKTGKTATIQLLASNPTPKEYVPSKEITTAKAAFHDVMVDVPSSLLDDSAAMKAAIAGLDKAVFVVSVKDKASLVEAKKWKEFLVDGGVIPSTVKRVLFPTNSGLPSQPDEVSKDELEGAMLELAFHKTAKPVAKLGDMDTTIDAFEVVQDA